MNYKMSESDDMRDMNKCTWNDTLVGNQNIMKCNDNSSQDMNQANNAINDIISLSDKIIPKQLNKDYHTSCKIIETTNQKIVLSVPSSPKKDPTDEEIVPSTPKTDSTDKEVVLSSPKKELTDEEVGSSSLKEELTDKEVGPSSLKEELTDKEVDPFSLKEELTYEKVVSSSPKTDSTDEEIVPSSPERDPIDNEVVPPSPERELELVLFSPEKETTGKEIGPFLPEEEPTHKNTVSFSLKRESADKKIILKPVLQERTSSLPQREPIDQDVSSSSPKKATDSLYPPEPNTPNKKRASSSPEQMPPDKKNGRFSIDSDEELRSPYNGLTGRSSIPFFMNTLDSFIWIQLVLVMFSPVSMATNDVNIFPSKTVGVPGDNIAFVCTNPSRTALSIQWLVNGTLLENSRLVNVFQEFYNRSKTAEISFDLPLEHNVTTIQCIYNFVSENVLSETITLLLQGLLAAVGSPSVDLVGTNISLTWTAPFTLDISNVDPDITYCVDVVNSTSSSAVLSESGITVTGFNFSIPIDRVCDNYTFTVTPVNVVGNGTAVTRGYSQDFSSPRASEELLLPISESTYQITMSAPVCYGELTVINDNTGDETHIQGSDLNIAMNIIMFTSEKLKKNQLYTVSVNASNINGSAVSYVSLSTHDVRNATFDVTSHTITTEYFEYSTAMGALYIFIFINEDRSLDFKKSIYLPLDMSSSHNYTLPDISPGQYQMSVYDIDGDVTLYDSVSYPANTNMFSIISDDPQASYSQNTSSELARDCSVTYVDDVISAMCSYSNDSSVTGFQMIVQLNNVDEVHKLIINSTTEDLSPGPVTVQVEESGTYHVAIFPIMGERGIVDTTILYSEVLSVTATTDHQTMIPETSKESSQGWIIGVVMVLLVLIIIIIVGVGIGYIHYRKHMKKFPVIENNFVVGGHAHSSIKNGPTITGIPRPPITIIPISIESNTGTRDSGISSTDSTANSIHPSAASAQSTESEDNPGGEESKPGHEIVNQVWEDNSIQSMDYNTGQSMEEENKEANSQQALNPITEGIIGSNTDDTKGSNTESAYAELSHSHLPGHTDVAVNCHDHEYGEIGGSINNGLTYSFVQPKRDKLASIAFELSKDVNKPNYVTVLPHSKEYISLLSKDDLPSILDHLKSVTKWRSLGMVFVGDQGQDEKSPHIQQNFPVDSLESVILYWLESGPKENHTWKYLVTALKKLGEDSVANHILRQHTSSTNEHSADPVKPATTKPKQEDQVYRQNLGEDVGFRDSEDSISTVQTLQDCGSSVPFLSQCFLSKDPSSAMNATKTCLTGHMVMNSVKSSHVALKPATKIFNDFNVKFVYLETKSSSDISCSNDYLMGVNVYGETAGEDRHEEKVICKMKQNIQEMRMKNILVK